MLFVPTDNPFMLGRLAVMRLMQLQGQCTDVAAVKALMLVQVNAVM